MMDQSRRTRDLGIAALFAFATVIGCTAWAGAAERPNIVFVFADDWGRFASAYAKVNGPGTPNDVVQTPNFDRVAREGVLFRHAFVNAPSCTPCRSSILSGQYFWRTGRGAILHGAIWDPAIPSFPLLLQDAGYHIGKSFKVWSPGRPADAPFGGQRHAYEKAGRRYNDFSENITRSVAEGKDLADVKDALLDEVTGNFTAFLADRKPGQPFCYWFGPTLVHRKWVRGSGKAIWGIDPDRLEGKLPPFLPDVPDVREDFADYLGEIQALDAGLGRLIAALEKGGELDNTLLVVSGDHGPPGFPRGKCNLYDFGTAVSLAISGPGVVGGRVVDDFVSLVDLAPTFLEVAGLTPPVAMTGKSLVPVLRSTMQGQVDPERTWVITGRERHVANARDGNLPYPQRALRTNQYLYILNFEPERWPLGNPYNLEDPAGPSVASLENITYTTFMDMDASPTKAWLVTHRADPRWKAHYELAFAPRPREELYALADDRHQVHNVAADPAHADLCRDLNRRLLAELERTGDPRVTGDRLLYEQPPFTGPPPPEQR